MWFYRNSCLHENTDGKFFETVFMNEQYKNTMQITHYHAVNEIQIQGFFFFLSAFLLLNLNDILARHVP